MSDRGWTRGPDFDPFDALGISPRDDNLQLDDILTTHYRRAVRHVFGDRPGTPGLTFPSHAQVNSARDYFRNGQLRRLRLEWRHRHASTWNPEAPLNSDAVHQPIPRQDDGHTEIPSTSSESNNGRVIELYPKGARTSMKVSLLGGDWGQILIISPSFDRDDEGYRVRLYSMWARTSIRVDLTGEFDGEIVIAPIVFECTEDNLSKVYRMGARTLITVDLLGSDNGRIEISSLSSRSNDRERVKVYPVTVRTLIEVTLTGEGNRGIKISL